MFKYKSILIATLIFVFIFNFALYASNETHYTTITGELNLVGSGELNHVVINNNNKIYVYYPEEDENDIFTLLNEKTFKWSTDIKDTSITIFFVKQ